MEKYRELVQVLEALGAMDGGQMARAWMALTDAEWAQDGEQQGQAAAQQPAIRIGFEDMFGSRRSETPVLLQFAGRPGEQQQQQQ